MKANNRKRNHTVTIALSIAAFGLLAFGSIGGARAAITNYSNEYVAELETQGIGVELKENGKDVNGKLMQVPGKLTAGKTFTETLAATNDGTIDEYVRITVHKYWIDGTSKDGVQLDLDPSMIKLVDGDSDWIKVDEDETDEIVVYYYTKPLSSKASTSDAIKGFIVDSSIEKLVDQETSSDGKTITTTYQFNGLSVGMDAEVNSVQTHNAHDAILSAWGVDAEINGDGIITAIN